MEIKIFEMRELKADEGMVLTNGEIYSSVGGSVYLGCNDNPDNYHEITEAEYEKIQAREAEKIEEVNVE